VLAASILAVVLVSSMSLVARRTPSGVRARELAVLSPYRNTRSGVKYVGDAACARCHAEISRTYRSHPMGRSLAPMDAAAPSPDVAEDGRPLFGAQGLEYSVEHRDGRVWHQETRRDSAGGVVARNEAEVQFVLGSGRQGFAYLIERDGFLFQSPIAWYAQKRRWDLAPGYERSNNHFHRPAMSACLYCHANGVEPVAGTVNRYRPPIFRGHAIGCERCHGPGELHVALPPLVDGKDMTIVNPANLEPPLRDAVCEQCHLNGLQPPGGAQVAAKPRGRLRRLPHAAIGEHRRDPYRDDRSPCPPPGERRGSVTDRRGSPERRDAVPGLLPS
jgi:hypothetical protein